MSFQHELKGTFNLQPFDEEGRRISALPSTIGVRLFSLLDDGSGFTPTESVLDVWTEEGVENSAEVLQVHRHPSNIPPHLVIKKTKTEPFLIFFIYLLVNFDCFAKSRTFRGNSKHSCVLVFFSRP